MKLETVGILSPGDMGHVVGQVLGQHGLRVITCLQGRSDRTRELAQLGGIEDVSTYAELANQADLILSILVPAQATAAAALVAQALEETGATLLYADCNAISPATVRGVGQTITEAGGRFVDASIIGGPPRRAGTRFYASGPHVDDFARLSNHGLEVIPMDDRIGSASALKMCYGALTKGLTALCTELLTAAEVLGVSAALHQEFSQSQQPMLARMQNGLPGMPPKARRWVGEMEEIAATFEQIGLTPQMLAGAADIYRFVGGTELADRNPEDAEPAPTLEQMIVRLAAQTQA